MAARPGGLIIADAGPLIILSKIGALSILRGVFGQVSVTQFVRDEVLGGGVFPGQGAIVQAIGDWIDLVSVDMGDWRPNNPDLGAGESSSIFLAEHRPGSLLVMDDAAARQEAGMRGLAYVGLIGIVLEAKKLGHIERAEPLFRAIKASGYFLSDKLMEQVLAAAGEGGGAS